MKKMYVIKIDDSLYVSGVNEYPSGIRPSISSEPEKSMFISSKRTAKLYVVKFQSSNSDFKNSMTVHEVVFP